MLQWLFGVVHGAVSHWHHHLQLVYGAGTYGTFMQVRECDLERYCSACSLVLCTSRPSLINPHRTSHIPHTFQVCFLLSANFGDILLVRMCLCAAYVLAIAHASAGMPPPWQFTSTGVLAYGSLAWAILCLSFQAMVCI